MACEDIVMALVGNSATFDMRERCSSRRWLAF